MLAVSFTPVVVHAATPPLNTDLQSHQVVQDNWENVDHWTPDQIASYFRSMGNLTDSEDALDLGGRSLSKEQLQELSTKISENATVKKVATQLP